MTDRRQRREVPTMSGYRGSMPSISAFILAGGRGRRLAPFTTVIPKPLVPVGEQSVLELLIRQLAAQDITDITISLGYLGHLIRAVIGDGTNLGVRVSYTEEREPLGTAGALGLMQTPADSEHVLVINGDTFTDLDFGELMADHVQHRADVTVGSHWEEVRIDYGVLRTDASGRLTDYQEKPSIRYLVSMGVNMVSTRALARLHPVRRIDFPSFIEEVSASGGLVRCHETECVWLDLGRADDVRLANEAFEREPGRFGPPHDPRHVDES